MKIGVLTQPMAANYGCNLQAYALQTVLESMGCDVEFLNRWIDYELRGKTSVQQVARLLKDMVKLVIGKSVYHVIEQKDQPYYWQNFIRFQRQYLHLSRKLYSTEDLKEYSRHKNYDALVVGSDQVWRPAYNQGDRLCNMFLDFSDGVNVKRIAYAASFGVDCWEYTEEQAIACQQLISNFDAVSVREDTGVNLCRTYFRIKARHVLDPTLLLGMNDYNDLINGTQTNESAGNLFCYILDTSSSVQNAIRTIENKTGFRSYTCLPLIPENTYNPFRKSEAVLPSIEQWLKSFKDAEMVLADSFHGMVFSIIYNKPFWVIGNRKRGLSRFTSLLKSLGLEDRLIAIDDLDKIDINSPIDWKIVNNTLTNNRINSVAFLECALKNESTPDKYDLRIR